MRWLHPPRLAAGDHVALISPASPVYDPAAFKQALHHLQSLGFVVHPGRHAHAQRHYLAGHDEQRRADLMEALQTSAIRGLFCTRGGYGTSRLLQGFDPGLLRRYPKVLMGYSDITLLHLAYEQQKVHSFWGPMPASRTGFSRYSKAWFEKLCMAPPLTRALPLFNTADNIQVLAPGRAEGRLSGGTLTLLAASLGTASAFDSKGKLIFLEDIDEPPYKVDRLLTQLLMAGKLKDANGFVLGRFRNSAGPSGRGQLSVHQVLQERLGPLRLPMVANAPLGHIQRQLILPYGHRARLDTRQRQLFLLP